jgi:hypothetical protein
VRNFGIMSHKLYLDEIWIQVISSSKVNKYNNNNNEYYNNNNNNNNNNNKARLQLQAI